jgi:hypothetical protein
MRTTIAVLFAALCGLRAAMGQDPGLAAGQPYMPPGAYQMPGQALPPGPLWNQPYSPPGVPAGDPRGRMAAGLTEETVPLHGPPGTVSFGTTETPPMGGWLVGAGFYYLQPRWGSNPAFDKLATDAYDNQTSVEEDFHVGGHFAPLIWLGYVGETGVGLRGRWWQFQGDASVTATNPNHDDSLSTTIYSAYPLGVGFGNASSADFDNALRFEGDLKMSVADAEILWDLRPGRWSLLLGGGVRYAHLAQSYKVASVATPVDPLQNTLETDLLSDHRFDGIGPLVSLEARYPIGSTGFALLGSTRGALLLGTGRQHVSMLTTESDATGPVSEVLTDKTRPVGGVLPVLEFEIGAQWERKINYYRFVVETALVSQAWFYAGNAANHQSVFSSTFPNDQIDQDTLGLIGLRLTAGMTY